MLRPTTIRKLSLVLILPVLLIALALAAAACGGGGEGEASDAPAAGETPSDGGGGEPAAFDVSLGDDTGEAGALASFFTPNEFTVAAGQELTFSLSNDGTAIHNMRIAGPDGEYNTDDDTVVDPEILNAGDTAVLVWTAPDQPGTIVFRCDFHPIDMIGTITVQ